MKADCTGNSDTRCADCTSSRKPVNSVWTTQGNCAWRCETGYTLDFSDANQSACVQPTSEPPPSLSPDAIVPVVTLQIQLPITKSEFLLRQAAFVAALARSAGVNPGDVEVVSVEEVVLRRQQVALNVLTRVRTTDAEIVESSLTLDSVNQVLAAADLPPASALSVDVESADATGPPEEGVSELLGTSQSVDFRLIVLSVGAGFGGLVLLGSILLWYRRTGKLLWRQRTKRVCTCHGSECHAHLPAPGNEQMLRHDRAGLQRHVSLQAKEAGPPIVTTKVLSPLESQGLGKDPLGQVHGMHSVRKAEPGEKDSSFVDVSNVPLLDLSSSRDVVGASSGASDWPYTRACASGELSFVAAKVSTGPGHAASFHKPSSSPERSRTGKYKSTGQGGKTPSPFRNPPLLTAPRHGHFRPPHDSLA